MEQFPEYLGGKVGTLYNVTGLKQKDNGAPISSSEFREFPVHTFPFCARMMRAYLEGNTWVVFVFCFGEFNKSIASSQ